MNFIFACSNAILGEILQFTLKISDKERRQAKYSF